MKEECKKSTRPATESLKTTFEPLIVELGKVTELTGKTGSGQFDDGGKTSSDRKDKYGGAGER